MQSESRRPTYTADDVKPTPYDYKAAVNKYALDRRGIRNVSKLQKVCLNHEGIVTTVRLGRDSLVECLDCHNKWYISHCWSCGTGRLDSRDPLTPRCIVCTWMKCAICGACNQDGCSTNSYKQTHKFINEDPLLRNHLIIAQLREISPDQKNADNDPIYAEVIAAFTEYQTGASSGDHFSQRKNFIKFIRILNSCTAKFIDHEKFDQAELLNDHTIRILNGHCRSLHEVHDSKPEYSNIALCLFVMPSWCDEKHHLNAACNRAWLLQARGMIDESEKLFEHVSDYESAIEERYGW